MAKNKRNSIPKQFASIEEAADFWDSHDLTDYSDSMRKVEFDVQITKEPRWIELGAEVAQKVCEVAKQKNIPVQILVNEWLRDKLSESLSVRDTRYVCKPVSHSW